MKAVVQRVLECTVSTDGIEIARIGAGVLVLLGVAEGDSPVASEYLAEKIIHLRIFEDETGRMNQSLLDRNGEAMVVSQFTLLADCRKGRRPSFTEAAPPDRARELYEHFAGRVRQAGLRVQTGKFQAHMAVSLINDGPVTVILESR